MEPQAGAVLLRVAATFSPPDIAVPVAAEPPVAHPLNHEIPIEDKDAYVRAWNGGWIRWQYTNYDGSHGGDIHAYFCIANERDLRHFAGR
jgi:hypothetical protein